MAGKKEGKERNPFGNVNVVEALTGGSYRPRSHEPSDAEILLEEEKKRRERQSKLRKMKPWQRKKYERDAKRVKLSVRIPKPLSDLVNSISDSESVSPSSAALWLAGIGVNLWRSGNAEAPEITKSRSLRTENSIVISGEWDGPRVKRTFDDTGTLKESLMSIVAQFRCGISDALAWLMELGAEEYRKGLIPEREPSDNIRYPFKLKLPKVQDSWTQYGSPHAPNEVLKRFFDEN